MKTTFLNKSYEKIIYTLPGNRTWLAYEFELKLC